MGTWNPDASFGNLRDNDFTDIHNLRMQTIGGYELRTGYNKYEGATLSTLEILCKAEYRHKIDNVDVLFDMTVYQTAGDIKISAINRGAIADIASIPSIWKVQYTCADLPGIVVTTVPSIGTGMNFPPSIAAAYQYGTYLIVTVYGIGTFAIYPDGALANTWNNRPLGKNLANTPWQINFADDTTGDIFLPQFTDAQVTLDTTTRHVHHWNPVPATPSSDPIKNILPPYLYSRIPLGIKYWRADNAGFNRTEHRYFITSPSDPAATGVPARATPHLQTRAWGYRFVFVRSFIDAKGNKIKFRSNASVDIWVRDNIYCPPQIYTHSTSGTRQKQGQFVSSFSMGDKFQFKVGESANVDVTSGETPALTGMKDLFATFIKYVGQSYAYATLYDSSSFPSSNTGIDEATWLPAMVWMGFERVYNDGYAEEYNFDPAFKDAWFTEVPASVLKGAPLAKFKWTDFSTTDGTTVNPDFPLDAVEIEVYRTAWSDGDAKLTDGDPAFQPHLYGYVGSIKPDQDFTDDVNDLDIDFSLSPDLYDGFLAEQFSGQVIREYNNKLAIGNCATSYYIFNPWKGFQLFVVDNLNDLSTATGVWEDLITTEPSDGLPTVFYGLQYVDSEGNISDMVRLSPDLNSHSYLVDFHHYSDAYIVTPQGYDPSVTAINVWFSIYQGGTRLYKLVKSVQPDAGFIKIHYDDVKNPPWTDITTSPLTKNTKTSLEGGEVIWSNTNEMFEWPALNARVISKTASITAMESVVGELMVFSDSRIDYDNISITNPRGEEVTKWVGSIGRWTYCKVDKVVFFLSANGLFFAEPGGVVPFPANVQTVVLKYIRETIPTLPDMANARRATIGYDGKRYELWMHIPSSRDLWEAATGSSAGSLPEITIVYKFFNPDITKASVANFVNYRFDLCTASDEAAKEVYAVNKPIFQATSDGKLFVSYKEIGLNAKIATLDCDADALWTNPWAIEHAYGLGEMNLLKLGRYVQLSGDFDCELAIRTSNPNPAGQNPNTYSFINPAVPSHPVTILPDNINIMLAHRIGGTVSASASVIETTAYAPIVRIEGESNDVNIVNIKAIDYLYWILHNHPN